VPRISPAIPARASSVAGRIAAAARGARHKIVFANFDRELHGEATAAETLRDISDSV